MANGISLTRHDGLTLYAEALAQAGAAVLIYDHRHLGDSGGQPRQHIRLSGLKTDCRSAVEYARRLDGVDAQKIVLWGYSLSAGTAVAVGASDTQLAGMILMCPFLDGLSRVMANIRVASGIRCKSGGCRFWLRWVMLRRGANGFGGAARGVRGVLGP